MTRPSVKATFRRLTIGDPLLTSMIADLEGRRIDPHRLDERTEPLRGRVRFRLPRPFEAQTS